MMVNYRKTILIKSISRGNDGSEITLFDNDYLVVSSSKYKIVEGTIDLNKFYTIFME